MQTGNEQGEQISFFDQDLWFSKMSKACFPQTGGADFRCVLEETARVVDSDAVIPRLADGQTWSNSGAVMGDEWSIAWRLHDAQFWGVPQRRRRVALVADFGGQTAPEILFEREGVSGNPSPFTEQGQGTSADSETGIGGTSYTLKVRGGCEIDSHGKRAGKGALVQEELSGTLSVSDPQTLITYAIDRAAFNQGENAKYDFSVEEEIAQPIVARGAGGVMTSSEVYKQETTKE